jgi:hypothetical protein
LSPVRFLDVCAHRLGGHLRRHHPILEPGKYTLLKVPPWDRAGVRAGAIGNAGRTGITVLAPTDAIWRFRQHDVELLALNILLERLDAPAAKSRWRLKFPHPCKC